MMCNNISFKGFNNILCAFDVPVDRKRVTYISMQLNDEGVKDLARFKELRAAQGFLPNEPDSDVLTLTHVVDSERNTENLYLGTKDMFFGDELLAIEKSIPKYMTQEKYQKEKDLHMKAYTQLASITKRLMAKSFDNDNENKINVINKIYNTFLSLRNNKTYTFSQPQAFELLNIGCLNKVKFQDVALFFNEGIKRTMGRFFV